jgi:hypothetical protein
MASIIKKILVLTAVGFSLAVSSRPSDASPITVSFEKVGPGVGNAGQYNWNTGNITYDGIKYTPYGNQSSSPNHIVMFCIERDQFINNNTTYSGYYFANLESAPVGPTSAMSITVANALRAMWGAYRDDLDIGTLSERNDKSAAFQHAVWHLLDPNYNPSLSSSVLSYYTTFLNSSTWNSPWANLAAIVHSQHQDQIFELQRSSVVAPRGNVLVVPAPATLAVAVLIAPALVFRRRWTR